MVRSNSSTGAPDFGALTTYKLRSWNELYGVQTKRYFHAPDGAGLRTVEITPDLRIACRCALYASNLRQGLGPCEHVIEALDFLAEVGYRRLPTRKLARS